MKTHYRLLLTSLSIPLFTFIIISCSSETEVKTCTDTIGCVRIYPGDAIQIGVIQALEGGVANLGQAQIRGLELALAERNGEILGFPVALTIENTGCTAEGGANAALKIIADPDVVAIFGTTCSAAAATAAEIMSKAGLVMVSGNNSAPYLTSKDGRAAPMWQSGFFRTAANEGTAGAVAAEYAYLKLGLRKAATINDGDIYTRGLTESFQTEFIRLGGQVVFDSIVDKGDMDMLPIMRAVAYSEAELLLVSLFQAEAQEILVQTRKMEDLSEIIMIGSGALINNRFLDTAGELAKGMCFISPALPTGAAVNKLTAAYEKKYGEKPGVRYYLTAYDAARLLFHAIEEAAVLEADGSIHIGRQKLRNILYETRGFAGLAWPLDCDQFGDCGQSSFQLLCLDNPGLGLKGLMKNIVFTDAAKK